MSDEFALRNLRHLRMVVLGVLAVQLSAAGAITEHYVTDSGSGLWMDSNVPGDPCSLATALANATAGDRVNVKAGSYSLGTTTWPAGTAASPVIWRGYATTIGDGYQGRANGGTGALVTTNMPTITCIGAQTLGAYNLFESLVFTSTQNGSVITGGTRTRMVHCSLSNTHATGSSVILFYDNNTMATLADCDLAIASSSSSAKCISTTASGIVCCRITGAGGTAVYANQGHTHVSGCAVYNSNVGIEADYSSSISGCTFSNIAGEAVIPSSFNGGETFVANCVAYDILNFIRQSSTSRVCFAINNAAGGYKSGGARWLNQGDQPEYGAITLTASPFTSSSDFRLNADSGGGLLCLNAGLWPNRDLGALGHAATFPAAGNVLTGSGTYGDYSGQYTPTLTLSAAANTLSGSGTYGNPNSPVTPLWMAPSISDVWYGVTYGVSGGTVGTKRASSIANCTAGNVKNGVVIDDVTGAYAGAGGGVSRARVIGGY